RRRGPRRGPAPANHSCAGPERSVPALRSIPASRAQRQPQSPIAARRVFQAAIREPRGAALVAADTERAGSSRRAPGARRRDAPAAAARLGRPPPRTHGTNRGRHGQAVRRRSRAVGALFTGADRPFSPPVIDAGPRGAMIVYAIAKYLVYSFWCYVGLRMLARQMNA